MKCLSLFEWRKFTAVGDSSHRRAKSAHPQHPRPALSLLKEPPPGAFLYRARKLEPRLVSCTGSEFCGFAIIGTKNRALAMIKELEQELIQPRPVLIGQAAPNSCGQPKLQILAS